MDDRILRARKHALSVILMMIVGLLALWFVLGRTSLFHTSHYRRLYSTEVYPLSGNARLTQDFESVYPGLYRVDIYFKNPGGNNGGEVIFRLKDFCAAPVDLETIVVPTSDIADGEFHPFVFSPINETVNRRFCIVLETRSSESPAQLGVYASNIDAYLDGAARYKRNTILEDTGDKSEIKSTLAFSPTQFIWIPIVAKNDTSDFLVFDIGFQLYYDGPVLDTMKVLLTRLAANKPYFFGASWFYVVLFAVYLIGLIWLGFLAFKTKPGPKF